MAARPIEAGAPEIVDQVLLIPVHEIELGERLRPVDPVWAGVLGRIMQAEGQQTPIEVCRLPGKSHYTIVSGGHRFEGARSAGLSYLRAIVVTADRAERRMREISENLWRKGLEPIDRAAFIAELVALHKVRNGVDPTAPGRSVSAQVRWQTALKSEADDTNATIADAYGWADEVAEEIGLSRRTIEYDLLLHRRLSPHSVNSLRACRHPVLKNASQLRSLAKLDEVQQLKVVNQLVAESRTVADALTALAPKTATSAEDKRLSAFIGAFSRMSLAEKKGAMQQLLGLLPEGMLRELVPAPKAAPNADPSDRDALIEAIAEARELIDCLIEDEVISDGPVAIVDYERVDRLRKAEAALQLAAMPLFGDHVAMGGAA